MGKKVFLGMFIFVSIVLLVILLNGIHQKNVLLRAIENDDIEQAQRAIYRGAFVNLREECFAPSFLGAVHDSNPTPLIKACELGNEDIIKLLVENGANVNKKDNMTQITPIEMGLHYRKTNRFRIATYLLGEGADINKCNIGAIFIYTLAVYNNDDETTIKEGFEFLKYLLEEYNLTPSLERGTENPLTFAAKHNNFNAVRYFVENKYYDINSLDEIQDTALLAVIKYDGNLDMVKLLVDLGADIELTDEKGKTAYEYALEKGCFEITDFFNQIKAKE